MGGDGLGDEPVIAARELVKVYGDRTAVAGVDFQIGRGCAFGFLGRAGRLLGR
jgi:lipooligosaccharide transport system ATP-binding protein